MEGPTPIGALIHAATMVTAGIFMVARMSPLFELSTTALGFVIVIGSITAFFMGLLGIVQNDIKRVVAYSTLSQLGYMTVALGASAYSAAIFHLMTHAFFKALLFLAAGSVIIALHHEQDIRKMGGIRKYMPITYWTSLVGSLALIGFPGSSGFFSKDLLIEAVKESHWQGQGAVYWIAYLSVLLGVFITALYTFRMFFLVFHGEERMDAEAKSHLHETSAVVTVPLILLAIPSAIIGCYDRVRSRSPHDYGHRRKWPRALARSFGPGCREKLARCERAARGRPPGRGLPSDYGRCRGMNLIRALFTRELRSYFATPVAYVFIVIYLVLMGTFTFYLGQFFERGQADLSSFFNFHPWLYLFLVPAISMRLWAEERKTGSIELLMTMPITAWQAVLGKYLAAWAFTGIALALTFPVWITVNYLGDPDNGAILAAYVGSMLMAGGFLAIGACLSATTRNQVIAFVITIVVCFGFLLSGFPMVLDLFSGWAPQALVDGIASLSFLTHFANISKGVIDFRDLVYFGLLIGAFLYANTIVLQWKQAD